MPFRLILTGATGMVGEGVLLEALGNPHVSEVLIINRRPSGITHPKLREILHADFMDIRPLVAQVRGYDACFFCLGVSSVGMKEAPYYELTHELTLHVAGVLVKENPSMTFCYISGAGTDSSENGKLMWARVKGKTENDLMKLPFKKVYNFRPGILVPTKGQKNILKVYHYLGWLTPMIKKIAPNQVCTLSQLGKAMIQVVRVGYGSSTLEVKDILKISEDGSV
ncbi:MAG: epimerase [Bacteroidota bacterium]|nr:epimerase [Bacteroidota bacterium]